MKYEKQTTAPKLVVDLLKMDLSLTSTNLSLSIAMEIAKLSPRQQKNCLITIENIISAYNQISLDNVKHSI